MTANHFIHKISVTKEMFKQFSDYSLFESIADVIVTRIQKEANQVVFAYAPTDEKLIDRKSFFSDEKEECLVLFVRSCLGMKDSFYIVVADKFQHIERVLVQNDIETNQKIVSNPNSFFSL